MVRSVFACGRLGTGCRGGPKGVGALVLRQGLDVAPQMRGGGQEMGRRAGTENLIGIAGFAAAAEAAARDLAAGGGERGAGGGVGVGGGGFRRRGGLAGFGGQGAPRPWAARDGGGRGG